MAQIEVEAAAHVLGMQVGERARFEDTPFLRGAIRGGKLRLVCEAADLEHLEPQLGEGAPELVDAAVDRHPAGKRRTTAEQAAEWYAAAEKR
jgi:hypothetical protein